MTLRHADPVNRRLRQVGEFLRHGTGRADALHGHLDLENLVRAIGAHDGDHLERLPRLRPQRLRRVHCAAVRLKVDDPSIGARHRRADGRGRSESDRPARQGQVGKLGAPGALVPVRPAAGQRLVDHDASRRLRARDDGAQSDGVELCVEGHLRRRMSLRRLGRDLGVRDVLADDLHHLLEEDLDVTGDVPAAVDLPHVVVGLPKEVRRALAVVAEHRDGPPGVAGDHNLVRLERSRRVFWKVRQPGEVREGPAAVDPREGVLAQDVGSSHRGDFPERASRAPSSASVASPAA